MIVDSSAVIAILRAEPDASAIALAIAESSTPPKMSAGSYLECCLVADRDRDPIQTRRLDAILEVLRVEVVDFTVSQAAIARAANRDFGRGSRHPAQLNFGDLMTYALAEETREPLVFKGDHFHHTDLELVNLP